MKKPICFFVLVALLSSVTLAQSTWDKIKEQMRPGAKAEPRLIRATISELPVLHHVPAIPNRSSESEGQPGAG